GIRQGPHRRDKPICRSRSRGDKPAHAAPECSLPQHGAVKARCGQQVLPARERALPSILAEADSPICQSAIQLLPYARVFANAGRQVHQGDSQPIILDQRKIALPFTIVMLPVSSDDKIRRAIKLITQRDEPCKKLLVESVMEILQERTRNTLDRAR